MTTENTISESFAKDSNDFYQDETKLLEQLQANLQAAFDGCRNLALAAYLYNDLRPKIIIRYNDLGGPRGEMPNIMNLTRIGNPPLTIEIEPDRTASIYEGESKHEKADTLELNINVEDIEFRIGKRIASYLLTDSDYDEEILRSLQKHFDGDGIREDSPAFFKGMYQETLSTMPEITTIYRELYHQLSLRVKDSSREAECYVAMGFYNTDDKKKVVLQLPEKYMTVDWNRDNPNIVINESTSSGGETKVEESRDVDSVIKMLMMVADKELGATPQGQENVPSNT